LENAVIRKLRLATGLILFTYVSLHLSNHVAGLWSLEAMEVMRGVVHAIWHTLPGKILLYGAFLGHIGLGLYAIFRRRDLRMSATDMAQLVLGLTIPFLLMIHVLGTRGAFQLYGTEPSYAYVLLAQWQTIGTDGVFQVLVLLISWIHGCMGMYFWLRLKPWFTAVRQYAFAYALLLPTLSLLGVFEGAREVLAAARVPGWFESMAAGAAWPNAAQYTELLAVHRNSIGVFIALLVSTLVLRWLHQAWERQGPVIFVNYDSGATVSVAQGMTILEASRLGSVPHASVCGGRGRCSTCRVRVLSGLDQLPPASPTEQQVLARVRAGSDIRLACQCRPLGEVSVTPLLQPATAALHLTARPEHHHGQEMDIAVLFVDIRAFTNIAESKLPYDVVFLLNRYFEAMGRSIEEAGGLIDKYIGDAVMALFGVETDAQQGCYAALVAAKQMGVRLSALNAAFANDLDEPLRIGIGIHHGSAVVGEMGYGDVSSLTAVGDTVNTASRLEALTKDYTAQLVVSELVLTTAGVDIVEGERHEVMIRGRSEPLAIRALIQTRDLPRDL
jgi:adenylate cyclase